MEVLTSKTPKLDLHGEVLSMTEVLVNSFVHDNYLQKKELIRIVHGKSTNILAREVHRVLKTNKEVKSYRYNNWNLGETIVELKVD